MVMVSIAYLDNVLAVTGHNGQPVIQLTNVQLSIVTTMTSVLFVHQLCLGSILRDTGTKKQLLV